MNPLKKIADVRIGYALARIFYDDKYLVEMSAEERQETAYFKAGAAAALGLVCYLIFFVLSPVKNPDQIVPLWTQGKHYGTGDKVQHEGNVYIAESAGVAGENPPVHTTGIESDGTINWVFVASPTADDGFFEPLPSRFATNPPSIPDPVVPDAIDWLGSLVTHKPNADPIDMPQMEKAYLKGVDLADPDFKALFNNKIPKLLSDANLQDFFEQNIPDAKAAIEPYKNAAGRSMGRYGTLSTLVDHITETQPQLLTRNRRVARSWTKASDFYRDNALSDDINKADSLRPIHGGNLNWSWTLDNIASNVLQEKVSIAQVFYVEALQTYLEDRIPLHKTFDKQLDSAVAAMVRANIITREPSHHEIEEAFGLRDTTTLEPPTVTSRSDDWRGRVLRGVAEEQAQKARDSEPEYDYESLARTLDNHVDASDLWRNHTHAESFYLNLLPPDGALELLGIRNRKDKTAKQQWLDRLQENAVHPEWGVIEPGQNFLRELKKRIQTGRHHNSNNPKPSPELKKALLQILDEAIKEANK